MQKIAQIIQLRPEHLNEYKKAHADVWAGVLSQLQKSNIGNYSIHHYNGLLFAYFEYNGSDLEADLSKMASDPVTQQWWGWMKPMQKPVPEASENEWWKTIEIIFDQGETS
ncbi:L-rhamnose mutarotase [Enterovibrio norvegicus]|uniref:L-rhamnose mutarotase n=1 Tax=Enterovibrio norvegicus TaxID=188144 RepID=UPI0013D60572|nr:L-rhamnose mutarotase [Enterovibrio norvegicus]